MCGGHKPLMERERGRGGRSLLGERDRVKSVPLVLRCREVGVGVVTNDHSRPTLARRRPCKPVLDAGETDG